MTDSEGSDCAYTLAGKEASVHTAADPFHTVDSDGENLALPICCFSESEDECCTKHEDAWRSLPLRERFACSLQKLSAVRRNNHRNRRLSELAQGSLEPPEELAASGGPLPRVDASKMSSAEFAEQFSGPGRPAMILGALDGCRALERWSSREVMLEHYGDVLFKISEIAPPFAGAHPLRVELPLSLYVDVVEETAADFPFYIFERELCGPRAQLMEDFKVPSYFRDDLYDLTEYTRAFYPCYRHIIIGVERTGSNMHVDPSCTSAWNTLLGGVKRWALFPPGDSDEYRARIGAPPKGGLTGDVPPPANWWLDFLPQLRASGADKELGLVECVQHPGETIYVPYGWWHCVLNIGFTTSVTQNLVAPESLPNVWDQLEADWPAFAPEFALIIKQHRPDIKLPAAAEDAAMREEAAQQDKARLRSKTT